jgi:tetratricopeptide (TPR) repeat protein
MNFDALQEGTFLDRGNLTSTTPTHATDSSASSSPNKSSINNPSDYFHGATQSDVSDELSQHAAASYDTIMSYRRNIRSEPRNATHMITLGLAYMNTALVSSPTKEDYQVAAALLTKGMALGVPRSAEISLALGNAHFNVWLKDGLWAQHERLTKAHDEIELALAFPDNNRVSKNHEVFVSLCLYAGRSEESAQALDKMVDLFPNHPKMRDIVMYQAMTCLALQEFDEAADLLKELIQYPAAPFDDYEVCLLLARVYDKCSEEDEDEIIAEELTHLSMTQRAQNRYRQAFHVAKKRKQVNGHDNASAWLSDFKTWRFMAEKCSASGHFIFAVDCYQQALIRPKAKVRMLCY